jgi:hypothetical protein
MKLKLMFVFLAIALAQITPSDAQSISPAGHYTKKRGGAGEMRVERTAEGWRVFVTAGGIPRGGATAADCTLIVVGALKNNTLEGEIKYNLDTTDARPSPENAVEPGHKMTITLAPQLATITYAEADTVCGMGSGIVGRYTKDRNR